MAMGDALKASVHTVRSYLVHTAPGAAATVAITIGSWPGCDALAADNRDVVIVVAEAAGRDEEEAIDVRLAALEAVQSVSLVSGFRDE